VEIGCASRNREAEAAAAGFRGEEWLEHPAPDLWWNARTRIPDVHKRHVIPKTDRYLDPTRARNGLNSVAQQVHDSCPHQFGIRRHSDLGAVDVDLDATNEVTTKSRPAMPLICHGPAEERMNVSPRLGSGGACSTNALSSLRTASR
jgi:hypothetical protein